MRNKIKLSVERLFTAIKIILSQMNIRNLPAPNTGFMNTQEFAVRRGVLNLTAVSETSTSSHLHRSGQTRLKTDHMSVMTVENGLARKPHLEYTRDVIPEKNRISVVNVESLFVKALT